jgi:hypothetical protein
LARQMGLDAKMVATCCGQPGSSADTASYVGRRYATSQVAAANNGDSPIIPASAVILIAKMCSGSSHHTALLSFSASSKGQSIELYRAMDSGLLVGCKF